MKLTVLQKECLFDLWNCSEMKATGGTATPYKLGRTWAPFKALCALGLAETVKAYHGQYVPYRITEAGRAALKEMGE